ncbi:MAG: response regulator transcription factor [Synergistaceae bacterium]|jgi:two-component system phosphate regulon response regulator PhoB/two-component system alkaline phosphatase synthesis response regulator PhoP|nr:response regulator transcription factor [Synergistaceae bacterium]
MLSSRILIVEDEESLAKMIAEALSRQGYDCCLAFEGDAALNAVSELSPDLVVLDVMLPRLDGFEVARRIKADRASRGTPIIMLTARDAEEDVLAGFAAGAADYVRKPFSIAELSARVSSVLGRSGVPEETGKTLEVGPLRIDPSHGEAYKDGRLLDLSTTEYRLLEALAARTGHTVTRGELLRRVWGMRVGDTRTLDVHIFRLRRKIEDDPDSPGLLHTVHGRGYRLAPNDETEERGDV